MLHKTKVDPIVAKNICPFGGRLAVTDTRELVDKVNEKVLWVCPNSGSFSPKSCCTDKRILGRKQEHYLLVDKLPKIRIILAKWRRLGLDCTLQNARSG